jgi:hypothetical protein
MVRRASLSDLGATTSRRPALSALTAQCTRTALDCVLHIMGVTPNLRFGRHGDSSPTASQWWSRLGRGLLPASYAAVPHSCGEHDRMTADGSILHVDQMLVPHAAGFGGVTRSRVL